MSRHSSPSSSGMFRCQPWERVWTDWRRALPRASSSVFSKAAYGASLTSAEGTRRQASLGFRLHLEDRFSAGNPSAAIEVLDELERLLGARQPRAVKLERLHDLHHVLPGLGEGDALDPVDGIDLRIARVAEGLDPFGDTASARIIGGKRQEIGAVVAVDEIAQMRLAELGIVGSVGKLRRRELHLVGPSYGLGSCRHQLHQTARSDRALGG